MFFFYYFKLVTMDAKKKQFHLSNLKLKLNKLNEQLQTYQKDKKICLDQTNIGDLENFKEQLQNIESEKQKLLFNIKNVKDTINNLSRDKSNLLLTLKKLPDDIKNQLQQEELIYEEEIHRINETYKELNNQYIESIYHLFDSKNELNKNINLKSNELELQINELHKIQTDAHSNRHDIIKSLKQKKQIKLQQLDKLQNLKDNINYIYTKINNLKLEQELLKSFKSKWIDSYYDSNITCTIPHCLNNPNFNNLDLNNQIDFIDSTILRLDKEIDNNIIVLNKTQVNHNISTHNTNQNYLNTHSKNSFKDQYKLQKEIKSSTEQNLLELQKQFDNFEEYKCNPIINEYYQKINELYKEKHKASERLDIMKNRIHETFINTTELLTNKINSINTNLKNYKDNIDFFNDKITSLDMQIQNNNVNYNNLIEIDDKIKKLEIDIKQIEKDNVSTRNFKDIKEMLCKHIAHKLMENKKLVLFPLFK